MAGGGDMPVLVADIGGTNARFALAASGAKRPQILALREFATARFGSPADAIAHYLAQAGAAPPQRAVIAVASPVTGDAIRLSNNPWSFSITALQRQTGIGQVRVINDFAAIGKAIPHLQPCDLHALGEAEAPSAPVEGERHCAVLGPGTGLGVCRVVLRREQSMVLETEGGHIGFAPGDDYETAVLEHLSLRYPRVSMERLISGPGLCNLHAAVCAIEDRPGGGATAEEITAAARRGGDAACVRAVELFCAILGSFAGDVALLHGAWHGLYLGGGMTVKLLPWLERGAFRRRFEAKGRFEGLMRSIPTRAILHAQPGLLGAAACALELAC
ncbi:MAG TPA: glucokinase [Nevskia sp.]|nr:glucokinase [Nevskia sp.]